MERCPLTPGCPCLAWFRPGRHSFPEVDTDEMDRESVLSRPYESGAGSGLSWHDKFEVTRTLTGKGFSAREIAVVLGCSERTIVRWRGRAKTLVEV